MQSSGGIVLSSGRPTLYFSGAASASSRPYPATGRAPAAAPLRALKLALLRAGEGLVEPAGPGDPADLLVVLDERGHFIIADPVGTPMPNLPDPIAHDELDAPDRMARRLAHVSRYLATLQLDCPGSPAVPADALELEIHPDPKDSPEQRFTAEQLPPTFEHGERMVVRLRNRTDQTLNVAILDLRPGWDVVQLNPFRADASFWPLGPGQERRVKLRLKLTEGLDEGVDVMKVFATTIPASLRWLELSLPDKPPPSRPLVVQNALAKAPGGPGADAFERLLASFAQGESPVRFLAPSPSAAHDWTVTQFAIRVVRPELREESAPAEGTTEPLTVDELDRRGRFRDAIDLARDVLSEARERPAGDFATARALNNLAMLHYRLAEYKEAEKNYSKALDIWDRDAQGEDLAPELALEKASLYNNFATLLRDIGRYPEALDLYERARGLWERAFQGRHPDFAASLNNQATLYYAMGRLDKAEELARRALQVVESTLGTEHPNYATCMNNLAALARARGDYESARTLYNRSAQVIKKALGESHPSYTTALHNKAMIEKSLGCYELAEKLLDQALKIQEATLGLDHPDLAYSLSNKASLCQATGRMEEALKLAERAIEIRLKRLGNEHPDYAASLLQLAALAATGSQLNRAAQLHDQAIPILRKLGKKHPDYALALRSLGEIQSRRGLWVEATKNYLDAYRIDRAVFGKWNPRLVPDLEGLAKTFQAAGRPREAGKALDKVERILAVALGPDHELTRDVRRRRDALRQEGLP